MRLGREALPGGGGVESDVTSLNFKTSRVGVYKCLMVPLSEIERKFFVFVGILAKGDSDGL